MHVRDLIELSAIVVAHAANVIRPEEPISNDAVENYWLQAKQRHNIWAKAIREYSSQCEASSADRHVAWQNVRSVLEEILASEILTRVWCATISHYASSSAHQQFVPMARSTLMAQSEARNRALNVMIYGQGSTLADAVALNRLRRRVEKWNDVLVGGLLVQFDARAFAFDGQRAQTYAEEFAASRRDLSRCPAWQLLRSSLTAAFRTGISWTAVSPQQNRGLALSVLSALPPDCVGGHQTLRNVWLDGVADAAQSAAGLVEEALLDGFENGSSLATAIYRFDAASGLRVPRF